MGLRVRNSLWVWSDTHFGHHNIIKFQQRPGTHEAIMLSNWIDRVSDDDQILHLGDVFMGSGGNARRWSQILSRMPGCKYLMLGNHDKAERRLYEAAGFEIVEPFVHKHVAFTHRPITQLYPMQTNDRDPADGWDVNVHGHIHGNTLAQADKIVHEGSALPGKTYVNVSVEVLDFAPRQLGSLVPVRP